MGNGAERGAKPYAHRMLKSLSGDILENDFIKRSTLFGDSRLFQAILQGC